MEHKGKDSFSKQYFQGVRKYKEIACRMKSEDFETIYEAVCQLE